MAGTWDGSDLTVVDNEVVEATSSLIPVTSDIEPNPVVERILQELYGDRIEEQMARCRLHTGRTPTAAELKGEIGGLQLRQLCDRRYALGYRCRYSCL